MGGGQSLQNAAEATAVQRTFLAGKCSISCRCYFSVLTNIFGSFLMSLLRCPQLRSRWLCAIAEDWQVSSDQRCRLCGGRKMIKCIISATLYVVGRFVITMYAKFPDPKKGSARHGVVNGDERSFPGLLVCINVALFTAKRRGNGSDILFRSVSEVPLQVCQHLIGKGWRWRDIKRTF